MKIVITGGGTGGHLYPCLALARALRERPGQEILFIGTARGLEARVVPEAGFPFQTILTRGVVGKSPAQKVIALFCFAVGLVQSVAYLARFSPRLVVGIGGYVAGPVLLAACLLRMKRVILEPNYVPGVMNALLAPFVHLVVTAFHETGHKLRARKVACLGVPVRSEIAASRVKRVSTEIKTVLILGGSQGSRALNYGMIEALPFLEKKPIRIIHQTGDRDFTFVQQAYARYSIEVQVMKFIERIADIYAEADLVVARAGAGTLSELAAAGLPALLIPFPHAQGHQEKNAEPFIAAGAACMILEKEWVAQGGEARAQRILDLLLDPTRLFKMSEAAKSMGHPNAVSEIVSACMELVGEDRGT